MDEVDILVQFKFDIPTHKTRALLQKYTFYEKMSGNNVKFAAKFVKRL